MAVMIMTAIAKISMTFNNVAIVHVKGNSYRIHLWYMSKNDAINILNGSNLVDINFLL